MQIAENNNELTSDENVNIQLTHGLVFFFFRLTQSILPLLIPLSIWLTSSSLENHLVPFGSVVLNAKDVLQGDGQQVIHNFRTAQNLFKDKSVEM